MITVDELASRLSGAVKKGDGYKAKCPAHDDGKASLTLGSGREGKVLVSCFAGCEPDAICSALGIKVSDLFPEREQPKRRITLAELAAAKKLPAVFLRDKLDLRDLADGGVGIPYRDASGNIVEIKRRTALKAKDGSFWPKGKPLMPYGLERLADARSREEIWLVEGETDAWTLWYHGKAALGLPGASTARNLEASHVDGIGAVFAIHEPDKGGDSFISGVTKRLKEIGYKGELREVRLDGAKDPSDLHIQDPGRFVERLEQAKNTPPQPASPTVEGFRSVRDRLRGEREERLERARRIMPFGISFLDEALGGVFPNDLILIGAGSGVGKTALATAIAHHNVKAGKRVHYFALEAEEREIERRMKFRELSDLIWRDASCQHLRETLNYIDWYSGKLEKVIDERIEEQIAGVVAEQFGTMHTFYKRGTFGREDLSRLLLEIQNDTDAAVIDHLHYVDVDGDNENRGVKDIVMTMRDTSLMLGKPLFIVAHLRKRDRKVAALVPDLDDFHGTSDTPKISTKAIMMAPARDRQPKAAYLWPTYVYAPKCRMDGSRARYCALIDFNARTQAYEQHYVLGRLSPGLDEFEAVANKDMPHWAVSAIR